MRTVKGVISRVGFTAIGLGAGLVLAAGTGVAAVHMSQTAAEEHSITVAQPAPSADDRVHVEDAGAPGGDDAMRASASDDATGVAGTDDATGQAEPEAADDSRSSASAAGQTHDTTRSPEAADDHGQDGHR